MKTIIFCNEKKINSLLSNWCERQGHELVGLKEHEVYSPEFRTGWDRNASSKTLGVWADYSVTSETGLKIIESFVENAKATRGATYYSPRPNVHLIVERPALAAMNPMIPFAKKRSILQRGLGKINRNLPKPMQFNVEKLFEVKQRVHAPDEVRVETPQHLQFWENPKWTCWEPKDPQLYKYDVIDRATEYFPFPKGIHVVLLNKCNLRCVMCPYHSPKYTEVHTSDYLKSKKMMTPETFHKIADYAGKNQLALQFGQIEETLLHPQLMEFIRYAKSKNVPHIHLTTNGTLLNESKALELAESGVSSVMFSVDAVTPETYKQIRGSDLAKTEANIQRFLSFKKGKTIKTWLSFIMQKQSQGEQKAFLEKWRYAGVDNITYYALTEFNKENGEMIRAENADHYDKGDRYTCASPWTQSVVFPDGEVSLCCNTLTSVGWTGPISAGTLANASFEEIWNGEGYKKVRTELVTNDFKEFDVCRKCEIWSASTSLTEEHETYTRQYNETCETISFKN